MADATKKSSRTDRAKAAVIDRLEPGWSRRLIQHLVRAGYQGGNSLDFVRLAIEAKWKLVPKEKRNLPPEEEPPPSSSIPTL